MKRLKKISFLILSVLAAAATVLPFTACATEKELEDILPKKYGESEGLYLYRGNVKSRTDGSEKQPVLQNVELDGETYGKEDFKVTDYAYATAVNKIFFTLTANRQEILYLYDYKAGTGEKLYAADSLEIAASDKYAYVTDDKNEKSFLYSLADGTLVCDEIYGTLGGDLLYKRDVVYDETEEEWKDRFSYFYGDSVKEAFSEQNRLDLRYLYQYENYVYFLSYTSPCVINLDDGTVNDLNFEHGVPRNYDTHLCTDGLYTLTTRYVENGDKTQTLYTLYKLSGGQAETDYEFGNNLYGNTMLAVQGTLYFHMRTSRNTYTYRYDAKKKNLRRLSSLPKEQPSRTQELSVGGYKFYVENKRYNEYQFAGYLPIPIPSYKWCYFLYREKDGKTDIMQYSTESRKLFDDICEF